MLTGLVRVRQIVGVRFARLRMQCQLMEWLKQFRKNGVLRAGCLLLPTPPRSFTGLLSTLRACGASVVLAAEVAQLSARQPLLRG